MNVYGKKKISIGGRFSNKAIGESSKIVEKIETRYRPLVINAEKAIPYAVKTSEISLLLRRIVESGFTVTTSINNSNSLTDGPGFTFVVNELLNPPSEEAANLFAQFLSELIHFDKLGARTYTEIQLEDESLQITYVIPVPSFSIIRSQLNVFLNYRSKNENRTIDDSSRESFESDFSHQLDTNYNVIEDEISFYCNR